MSETSWPVETDRLLLRPPQQSDLWPLAGLRRRPEVMAFPLGRGMDAHEADDAVAAQVAHWRVHGFGKAAVVLKATGETIGYCGVERAAFAPGLERELEIGWRLLPEHWGKGYATEAAQAVVRWVFDGRVAPRVLCFVDPGNERSVRVAEACGFRRTGSMRVAGQPGWPAAEHLLLELRPRDVATGAIERFAPLDEAQAAAKERILALLATDADVLGRDDAGHLTGSALVVDATASRVLVLWHKKLRKWLQPGGHLDGDWDLARSALREAVEETGIAGLRVLPQPIDVDVHRVAPGDAPPHDHHDVRFVVVVPEGVEPVANDEADAFRWLTPEEVASDPDIDGSLRRLVEHGIPRARAALPAAPPPPARPEPPPRTSTIF